MAIATSKKEITKRSKHKNSDKFNSIPTHLISDILARVASKSFTDLVNAKSTCKELFQAALEDHVFERVSIASFPVIPWKKTSNNVVLFHEKCITVGNPESLFRRGMIDYFSNSKQNSGLDYLKRASEKGHCVAKYVYCVIFICYGGDLRKETLKSLNLVSDLKSKLNVGKCREKVKEVVKSMWVRDFINGREEELRLRRSKCSCIKTSTFCGEMRKKKSMGWKKEEEFDDGVSCDGCLWDIEAIRFCNMLRTGRFSSHFVY